MNAFYQLFKEQQKWYIIGSRLGDSFKKDSLVLIIIIIEKNLLNNIMLYQNNKVSNYIASLFYP
jgi:hypothetical protein